MSSAAGITWTRSSPSCAKRLRYAAAVPEKPIAPLTLPSRNHSVSTLVTSAETLRWFREELYLAGPAVDRDVYDTWVRRGKRSAWDRARREVERILSSHTAEPLPDDSLKALRNIMKDDARRMGIDLPPMD